VSLKQAFEPSQYHDNPEKIAEYLNEAIASDDFAVFTHAIDMMIRAQNVLALSEETGLRRENLYRMFKGTRDPRLGRTLKILDSFGLQVAFKPREAKKEKAPRPKLGRPRSNLTEEQNIVSKIALRDAPKMHLSGHAISAKAIEVVDELYDQVMEYRSQTLAKPHKKSKAKFHRVLGGLAVELLISSAPKRNAGWMRIAVGRAAGSPVGLDNRVFRNVLDTLLYGGFIERFVGYAGVLELAHHGARRGRIARIRATPKLIALFARHGVTPRNASVHFILESADGKEPALSVC
jgi:probable addiction module antidote protein